MAALTVRRSDGQAPDTLVTAAAVAALGGFVDELVESGENVVGELYLSNSRVPLERHPNAKAHDSLRAEQ